MIMNEQLQSQIESVLKEVMDPEIGVSIFDLGLVRNITLVGDDQLEVKMNMTTPTCPLGGYIAEEVKKALRRTIPELAKVEVEIINDPPWSPDRMTPEARKFLGRP